MDLFGGVANIGEDLVGGAVEGAAATVGTTAKAAGGLQKAVLKELSNDFGADQEEDREDHDDEDEAWQKLAKSSPAEGAVMEDDEDDEAETPIPKFFSLKSKHNNKYLRYINEDEKTDGFLRFSGDKVVSPYSKFEVTASKSEKRFVHIRCSYNNKFWVRLSEDSNYIAAVANEPEDDQSKWSCTLFEPIFNLDNEEFPYQFRHIQLNALLYIAESAPQPHTNCVIASTEDLGDALSLTKLVDWDSIFILPKFVAFKSDNDKYLEQSGKYLKFSATDVEDPSAAHEIIATSDGFIRIKHVASGKYWCRDPNWIHLKSIDVNKADPNALFWPVKVDNNIVALRNMGNNNFCKRLTTEGKDNCLNAAVRTITETARFEVTEIVVSRSIEDIQYRLNDARVYGKKVLSVSKGTAVNNTDMDDHVTMKFRYEKKTETTWSSSVSTTLGIATKFTSSVPTVGSTKLELSFEFTAEKTWGETHKEKSFEETAQSVTIPARSKVKISGIITEAKCDVPFSYTRRDTLKNGKQVVRHLEDGIFTGVNTFDFKFETEKVTM